MTLANQNSDNGGERSGPVVDVYPDHSWLDEETGQIVNSETGERTPPSPSRNFAIGTGPANDPEKRSVYKILCASQLDLENAIMDEVVNFLEGLWGLSKAAVAKACQDAWSNTFGDQLPVATIFYGEERGSRAMALTIVELKADDNQERRRLYDRLAALEDTSSSTAEDVFLNGLFSRADLRALKSTLMAPTTKTLVDEIRRIIADDDTGERILTAAAMTELDEFAAGTRSELSL